MSCPYEDILLYARGLYGRQGTFALSIAKDRAWELSYLGDEDGAGAWRQVSLALEELIAAEHQNTQLSA